MAKKMYYSEQEASQKLGLAAAQIAKLVADGKLRVFADGPRKMFKAEEVEALAANEPAIPTAPPAPAAGESGEIILTPADSTAHDAIALSDDSGLGTIPSKEDTVPTSQGGVSVFDEADLEIEAADPMAKTIMAPSVEDGLSAESVGSGSGLLDLTREPDDTSLGAVLEDINVEGGASGSGTAAISGTGMAEAVAEEPILSEESAGSAPSAEPAVVELVDPMAGLFSGLAMASCIIMLVLAAVAVPLLLSPDVLPGHVAVLQDNLPIVVAAVAVVAILLAVIGYVTGRSAATRSAALVRK
jgi:hypothetical protein